MGYAADMVAKVKGDPEYAEWAQAVTTTPSNYAGPIGKDGYGCVYSWASRGDDRLVESNYAFIVQYMQGVDAWLEDDPDYIEPEWERWYDGTANHWLVGVLETIIVRVWDDDGNPTPHGAEAFGIYLRLQDYPVLDESDLSEREWDDFQSALDEAIGQMAWKYDDGDDEDGIGKAMREYVSDHAQEYTTDHAWALVEDNYADIRDQYYTAKAERFMVETADALREAEAAQYDGDLLTMIER